MRQDKKEDVAFWTCLGVIALGAITIVYALVASPSWSRAAHLAAWPGISGAVTGLVTLARRGATERRRSRRLARTHSRRGP